MKRHVAAIVLVGLFLGFCLTKFVEAEEYGGVEFPDGDVSFADAVINYNPTNDVESPYNDPTEALGIPNYADDAGYVALGDEGTLILQFVDNSLTTSGDNSNDLWVFEIGDAIEPTSVAISINGSDWIDVGETSGATSGIDIDAYVSSGVVIGEKYSFVKLTDLLPHQSGSPWEGADIDAVGAISSDEAVPLVANAGSDQIVYDEIILDGSASYPSDGIVSYQWEVQHREEIDNNIVVEGINPTISNLEEGFYDVTLTITNDESETSSDTMVFAATGTTMCENQSPFTGELAEDIQSYLMLTENSVPFNLSPGSYVQVYGSNGTNTLNVEEYARLQCKNFIGENEINIEEASSQFTVYRSGATVYLNSTSGTRVEIAATETPQIIRFADGSLELAIITGNVMLGDQVVDETESLIDSPTDESDTSESVF